MQCIIYLILAANSCAGVGSGLGMATSMDQNTNINLVAGSIPDEGGGRNCGRHYFPGSKKYDLRKKWREANIVLVRFALMYQRVVIAFSSQHIFKKEKVGGILDPRRWYCHCR